MRQAVIPRHGGPDVFELREAPDPVPGDGEILIRVRAAGINFADLLARIGLYPGQSDWGFRFIQLLERLGLAWDVRTPEGMAGRTSALEAAP